MDTTPTTPMTNPYALLNNEKGIALISTYIVGIVCLTLSLTAFQNSILQSKHLRRDVERIRAFEMAEAGIQAAMEQIGDTAYIGDVDTTAISATTVQSTFGDDVGTYEVSFSYDGNDWVVVTSTGTVGNESRVLEGRVFLESVLSKYSVFIARDTNGGSNLQLGYDDGFVDEDGDTVDDTPEGVPENSIERAKFYYDAHYTFAGNNIDIWGDFYIAEGVTGHSSYTTEIHGDLYVGDYVENGDGSVYNDGVLREYNVDIDDGFDDDEDRNGDDVVDSTDAPDTHDLTSSGYLDAERTETLPSVDLSYYSTNNDVTAFNTYGTRYLVLEDDGTGTNTVIQQLSSSQYTSYLNSGSWSGSPTATYSLPAEGILYNNGDIYVAGEVTGRVAVVSSDDIIFDDDVKYYGSADYASEDHSAAFIADDEIFLRGDSMELSGILFAQNSSGGSTAIRAEYGTDLSDVTDWDTDYSKSFLRFYGNTVMSGTTNTGYYSDRAWIWDPNLMKYRPPGVPIEPELRVVREVIIV